MWAFSLTVDGITRANHSQADVQLLVDGAGTLLAAGPGTRTDCIHATGQNAALLVAEASMKLLIVFADIAIM
jgi:hypothetical protein